MHICYVCLVFIYYIIEFFVVDFAAITYLKCHFNVQSQYINYITVFLIISKLKLYISYLTCGLYANFVFFHLPSCIAA